MFTCPEDTFYEEGIGLCEPCQRICDPGQASLEDCNTLCPNYFGKEVIPPTVAPLTSTKNGDVTSDEPFNWYIPVALLACVFIAATTICILAAFAIFLRRKRRRDRNRKDAQRDVEMAPLAGENKPNGELPQAIGRQQSTCSTSSRCDNCSAVITATEERKSFSRPEAEDDGYQSRSSPESSTSGPASLSNSHKSTSTSDILNEESAAVHDTCSLTATKADQQIKL